VKTLVFSILFSFSLQAFGAPTNVRVLNGTSKVVGEPITQVWGAMVGVADNTQTAPYDNCNETAGGGEDFSGCNPLRVNGSTAITIEFTETDELTQNVAPVAVIRQGAVNGGNVQPIPIGQINQQQARIGTNQTGTLIFTWADLCVVLIDENGDNGRMQVVDNVNRCIDRDGAPLSGALQVTYGFQTGPGIHDTASNTILNFYLYSTPVAEDSDFEMTTVGTTPSGCIASEGRYGFCDVSLFPGDGGGTVLPPEGFTERTNQLIGSANVNLQGRGPFAGTGATLPITVEKLRLYYSTQTWNDAHPSGNPDQIVELVLDAPNSTTMAAFRESRFGGLENGQSYLMRAATVDSSGSVTHLFDDDFCPEGSSSTPAQCPDYSLTPSEVAGLITESSCFITSATYGSPQAHQVTLFRKFRAKYLWTNPLGQLLSNAYNRYGPYGAKWVYENPSSKRLVRIGLYPFYGFAYLSVHYGFFTASLIYLIGLVVALWGLKKARSKGKFFL